MFNSIKRFCVKFFTDFIKDLLFKLLIFPTLFSIGGYMLTQQIIGSIILFIAVIIGIYQIRIFLINIHKNTINQIFNITNKLILWDNININCIFDEKNKKVAISLSYFIYNYSFNLINASFNSKTEYKIKILSDNDQIIYTEKSPIYPKMPPFLPFDCNRIITTYPLNIPFKEEALIEISGNLCLDYSTNNEQESQQTEKIISSCCKLIKMKNDKNESFVIAQPASPTS